MCPEALFWLIRSSVIRELFAVLDDNIEDRFSSNIEEWTGCPVSGTHLSFIIYVSDRILSYLYEQHVWGQTQTNAHSIWFFHDHVEFSALFSRFQHLTWKCEECIIFCSWKSNQVKQSNHFICMCNKTTTWLLKKSPTLQTNCNCSKYLPALKWRQRKPTRHDEDILPLWTIF